MMLMDMLASKRPATNDMFAKAHGYHDAATMAAYEQKRRERLNGGPPQGMDKKSILDSMFALHPAVLLGHVLSAWDKAEGK